MESGRRASRASTASWSACSRVSALTSRYLCSMRRSMARGSTSMQIATPSFMVTASGWAPPMPPRPAVSVMVPASVPPNRFAATAAKVS